MDRYEFLKRARETHGYKYQYPTLPHKVLSNENIDILLGDDLYTQKVVKHLMGRCPEKNTPKKTTEQFISECVEVWGDKYDYSLVEYKGALKKVKIIYDGVVFEQVAVSHLRYAPELQMNQESFIKRSIEKHGNKYDYSLVEYNNCREYVKIIYDGVVYEQTPESHLSSCPENRIINKTTKQFISESIELHGDKYNYDKTNYVNAKSKVIITCKEHGDFEQVANSHLMGSGCKKCGDLYKDRVYEVRYTTEEFIEEAKSVWGSKYDYSLTEYVNARTKVKIIYDGITYEQTPHGHLKYPVEGFLNQEIFLIKANRKWGSKYDYSLVEFISTKYPIKIIYNGEIFEQLPSNHLVYAPELRNTRTNDDFIKDSIEIHSGKYTYDKTKYINSLTYVTITCPTHGDFKQMPHSHLSGRGCPRCNDSFGEKAISKFLDKYNINYYKEHKFKDCRNIYPLRFDFYLPFMRTCIEFDGIQHFQPVEFFGGNESYEKLKVNDSIKNEYCEDNFIDIIRIRYDQVDDINKILYTNLKSHIKRLGLRSGF